MEKVFTEIKVEVNGKTLIYAVNDKDNIVVVLQPKAFRGYTLLDTFEDEEVVKRLQNISKSVKDAYEKK